MNIYPIQNSIVTQLSAVFSAQTLPYTAFNMPDAEADFQKVTGPPVVFVVYTGSNADPSKSTNVVAQKRYVKFSLEIHCRNLYKEDGLYTCRDVVEQILVGFKPLNCQRLYMVSDEISKTDDRIWVHVMQMECETMLVQVADDVDATIVPSYQEVEFI